ncbi:MAG: cation-translocating P-type ATPase [Acidimicrobiales bacterium]
MITAPPGPSPAAGSPPPAETEHRPATVELAVGGMHCSACATRIQGALASQPGVVSAAVNLATNKAFVAYDDASVGTDRLCEAVAGIGYTASPVEAGASPGAPEHTEHWLGRAAFAWALSIAAFALAMFGPATAAAGWTVLVLAVAVELGGGWPFLRATVRLARHGGTSMDTLIAVGTLAALAVTAVETIALGGRHVHLGGGGAFAAKLHGVMGPLIISILATGRAVEERARDRAGRAMHSLLALRPPTGRVVSAVDDDQGELVPPESIPVGALVRVRSGETIPLDGVVVSGWSAVDESMLTGEPLPRDRGPESFVTGGTRNGSGVLVVRVGSIASESVLTRLQRLVDEAQRDKAPLQRIADRVSSIFVPVILLGSLLTFAAWWWAAGNFGQAVLSGIAVLLVACPCAMGLATPVAMMVGCGRASALGILIRSGDALEQLARADMVAFDKTGTLTERAARVTTVSPITGLTPVELLELAAAVEADSDHPIAAAIRAAHVTGSVSGAGGSVSSTGAVTSASDQTPAPAASVAGNRELPGLGVEGVVGGHLVQVIRLDESQLPSELSARVSEGLSRGETLVLVTRDRAVVGAIAVSTPVRSEAAAAVSHLRSMGLATTILSGDSEPAVRTVATELGIDGYAAGLTASEKLDAIHRMQEEHHRVVMVGDGINDAPALAAADVGCAIGSGTEAAIANSDVALLGNDLEGVPGAVGVARSTLSIIQQNFGWAMGYNLSALPLAAAGLLDPLVAAVAMGLSSLIVVLNSLRLTRLGRSGLDRIQAPRVMRGARGLALSVAVPIVLFGGATALGQVVSPARGQPLLPTLPSIVDVGLPGGATAEVYLNSGNAGVNGFHLVVERGGNAVDTTGVKVTATQSGLAPNPIRMALLSTGHYLGYTVLSTGTWHFAVRVMIDGRWDSFSVPRQLH